MDTGTRLLGKGILSTTLGYWHKAARESIRGILSTTLGYGESIIVMLEDPAADAILSQQEATTMYEKHFLKGKLIDSWY